MFSIGFGHKTAGEMVRKKGKGNQKQDVSKMEREEMGKGKINEIGFLCWPRVGELALRG